jgi:hypothetical protein
MMLVNYKFQTVVIMLMFRVVLLRLKTSNVLFV